MTGNITRLRIAAYIIDFAGIVLVVFYGAGRSPKIQLAYQAPALFLYLGIALVITGMAMVFYDMKKAANSKEKHQDKAG